MATNKNPIFIDTPESANTELDNADGTGLLVVFTAGADGGAIMKCNAVSTDTVARILILHVDDGAVVAKLGEVNVPAGAGTDGSTPSVDLFDKVAMPGAFQADGSLPLGAAATLSISAKVTLTAAKTIDIAVQGGTYSA